MGGNVDFGWFVLGGQIFWRGVVWCGGPKFDGGRVAGVEGVRGIGLIGGD